MDDEWRKILQEKGGLVDNIQTGFWRRGKEGRGGRGDEECRITDPRPSLRLSELVGDVNTRVQKMIANTNNDVSGTD